MFFSFCKNYWRSWIYFAIFFKLSMPSFILGWYAISVKQKTLIYRFLKMKHRLKFSPTRLAYTALHSLTLFLVPLPSFFPASFLKDENRAKPIICALLQVRLNGPDLKKMPRETIPGHKGRSQFKRRFSLQPSFLTREEHSPITTPNHRSAR